MGIKTTDLRPINPIFPTAISPAAKEDYAKFFQVARTDTVSRTVAVVPADCSIVSITAFPTTNSNAGTTAPVTITITQNGSTISTGTFSALTAATVVTVFMTNLPNIESQPLLGDFIVTAVYAETGTASSTGGPFNFRITFVR